ncbi:MAG: cytidine deaminase [Acetatifactor sp.]|nr:cytidine deaminase [Acetatifactor sp.]MDE7351655.1 cytidine deaminase [Acetatifactor sp.]
MDKTEREMLILKALEARSRAYVPYSHYAVGAALLSADGQVIQGCNIENASYGATNCAERTAVFQAVAQGMRKFRAIAISGGMEGRQPEDYAYPCGICRQVLQEFAEEDFKVIVAKSAEDFQEYDLKELLPLGFGGGSIR